MLKLFDHISKRKKNFQSSEHDRVKIFLCGPTLYDLTHIGHARIFLTYDLLARHLYEKGFLADVLVNMTDINQNVFNKTIEQKIDYHELTKFYSDEFVQDLFLMNIHTITRLARASDYVPNMVENISQLIDNGYAYSANGNVYFDTSKSNEFGYLSKQSQVDLDLHRLDIGPNKKNHSDFLLWNSSDDFGFYWHEKFGTGIPWWHIQDTTIALENFGAQYDIHGGADELVFPHHEAHLAQLKSLAETKEPVKFWMYTSLVLSKGEKMSKSLGNMVLARDIIKKYDQNLLRLYLFSTHYREKIDYNEQDLSQKKMLLDKIHLTKLKLSETSSDAVSALCRNFFECLDDDLDSPSAINTIDRICDTVLNGDRISKEDFDKLMRVMGLVIR